MRNRCASPRALLLFCGLLPLGGALAAQVVPAASHGDGLVVRDDSDTPDPVHVGWSATVGTTAAHDSLSGWSLLESPSLGYRFNRVVSMDASVPFYDYLDAVRTGKDGDPSLIGHQAVWGDAALSTHFALAPGPFDYLGTLALSAPTGDEHLGVGTGHLGYNLNNHVERSLGPFTPDFEIGVGNTSALVRRRSTKSYTSSGLLLSLQAGSTLDLPGSFEADAEGYEQLPLGAQTVYSRAARRKGNAAVLTQPSDGEDNGVNLELDAPAMRRFLLSATLSRSIRLDDTTEGVTLAFLLHVPAAR